MTLHISGTCEYSNSLDQQLADAEREMTTLREKCKTYKSKAKDAREQLKATLSTAPAQAEETPKTLEKEVKERDDTGDGDEPVATVAAPLPEPETLLQDSEKTKDAGMDAPSSSPVPDLADGDKVSATATNIPDENDEKKIEIETKEIAHHEAEKVVHEQPTQLEAELVAKSESVQVVPMDGNVADTVPDPDSDQEETFSGPRSRPLCWWKWQSQKQRTSLPPSVLAVDLTLTMHLDFVDE